MVIRGITLGYVAVITIAALALLVPVPDNNRGDAFLNLALVAIPFFLIAQPVRLLLQKSPSPIGQLLSEVRAHWSKILWAIGLYFSLAISIEVFSGIKKSIPFVVPFYLDPLLISLDRILFFGTDPWRITHALLGWTTSAQVWLYNAWHFVHIGFAVWVAFSFDEAQKIRFTLLLQFIWLILGGLAATLMASVGPVMVADFYPDQSFAPLLETLQQRAPSVVEIKNVLIATMEDPLLISGISAMPSIHVAIAVAVALWLQRYRIRVLAFFGWSYAVAIYVGSIHLGWHYATDGIVSAVLVLLVWWLLGKFVAALETREFRLGRASPDESSKVSTND